jgi:hypothetical protein
MDDQSPQTRAGGPRIDADGWAVLHDVALHHVTMPSPMLPEVQTSREIAEDDAAVVPTFLPGLTGTAEGRRIRRLLGEEAVDFG